MYGKFHFRRLIFINQDIFVITLLFISFRKRWQYLTPRAWKLSKLGKHIFEIICDNRIRWSFNKWFLFPGATTFEDSSRWEQNIYRFWQATIFSGVQTDFFRPSALNVVVDQCLRIFYLVKRTEFFSNIVHYQKFF